jgi:four helix bundle protein
MPTDSNSGDPIERMKVYQLARRLRKECWDDAEMISKHPITSEIAGQLYDAVGSIASNLAEGYSRGTGRARAVFFEYALGSARESREWYDSVDRVLDEAVVAERQEIVAEIIRMLLAIIPRERQRKGFEK